MVPLVSLPGMTAAAPMWSGWIRMAAYRWYRGQQSALFWVDTSAVGDALHKPSTTIWNRRPVKRADDVSDRRYRGAHGDLPEDHLGGRPHGGARSCLAGPAPVQVPRPRPAHRPRTPEGNELHGRQVRTGDGNKGRRGADRRLVGVRGSAPAAHPARHLRRLRPGRDQARSHHLRADAPRFVRGPGPARRHGHQPRPVRALFPDLPRFCGQTFTEAKDRELGLLGVRAYNDWMVEEWCGPDAQGRRLRSC